MKKYFLCIYTFILSFSLTATEHQKNDRFESSYTFKGNSKVKSLIVKNYYGDIQVTGHSKKTVDVIIQKKIWARSKEQLEKAQVEVNMDISEEEDLIEFYVDGPFRDKHRQNSWHHKRYTVTYDFEIKVPLESAVDLETVNNGLITIKNVNGMCSAHNINGGIQVDGIRNIGKIYALNKDVSIQFDRNPTLDGEIGSLNGDVRLICPHNFSADLRIKTFNGKVYSDFETERIQGEPFLKVEKNGKNIYKTGHHDKIRIRNGGPLIKWDGFNGDLIIINKRLNKHASK